MASDGDVRAARLDIDDIAALAARIERLDVLVNNAAIDYDTDQRALTADLDRVRRALDTNLLGAWRMAQAFAPHLRASGHGRLVNVSSGAGSITEMTSGGTPGYRVSKLALNGLTRMFAAELRDSGVLVNSVCPGWTATDMGRRRQARRRGCAQHHLGVPARRRRPDRWLLPRRSRDRLVRVGGAPAARRCADRLVRPGPLGPPRT